MEALQVPLAHAWLLLRTHRARTGKDTGPDMGLEGLVAALEAEPDLDALLKLHRPAG